MTKIYRIIFILIISFYGVLLPAQVPQKWYFGQKACIDFNSSTSTPVPLGGSLMNTPAGCAVSYDGNYYTNGQTIWFSGGVLTDGTGLNGSMQSTQAAGIVKTTKADTFYVFTTDAGGGSKGFNYHIISKPPKQAKYKVVSKNQKLLSKTSEKIGIALHCNKTDYWVLTHGWNNNNFYAYLIDTVALDSIPVVSSIGTVHGGSSLNAAGYLKFSKQADKVACAITGAGIVELFKFDNINGTLSSPLTIPNISNAYGVEFDFTGNILYVSTLSGALLQFDVSQWNLNHILNSKNILATDVALFGALQRGPDGRIYLSKDNSNYLGAITSPATLGIGANYIPNFVFLNGAKCEAGLPQIFETTKSFDVKGSKACIGDTAFYEIIGDTTRIDSVYWNFGDTTSQTDTSTLFSPYYIYPKRGVYQFTLIIYHCNQADTLKNYVEVLGAPFADLGPDSSFCSNANFSLFGGYATTYLWHDGHTTQMHSALDTGYYWVQLTNKCGQDADTMRVVEIFEPPVFQLPSDTILCVGDSVILYSPFNSAFSSIWQDSLVGDNFIVNSPGIYSLLVVDSNDCKTKDDILVQFEPFPLPNLGNDTIICYGKNIEFNGNFPGNYLWNNGSTKPQLTTNLAGVYVLTVSNACGSNSDTVKLGIADCEQIIWVPNAFTPNNDGDNDVFKPWVENVNNYHIIIYDRWGGMVFESFNPEMAWDGKFGGQLLTNGLFVWKMTFSDFYNRKYEKHGFVIILK
jgi:gliding motility-associated-like protein